MAFSGLRDTLRREVVQMNLHTQVADNVWWHVSLFLVLLGKWEPLPGAAGAAVPARCKDGIIVHATDFTMSSSTDCTFRL